MSSFFQLLCIIHDRSPKVNCKSRAQARKPLWTEPSSTHALLLIGYTNMKNFHVEHKSVSEDRGRERTRDYRQNLAPVKSKHTKQYEEGIALANEQTWLIRLAYFLCIFQITLLKLWDKFFINMHTPCQSKKIIDQIPTLLMMMMQSRKPVVKLKPETLLYFDFEWRIKPQRINKLPPSLQGRKHTSNFICPITLLLD